MQWTKGVFILTLGISVISLILFFLTGFPFLFIFLAFPPFILQRKKKGDRDPSYQEIIACPKCRTRVFAQRTNYCPNCGEKLKD